MSLSRDLHVYLMNRNIYENILKLYKENKTLHVELYFYDLIKAPLIRAMKRIKCE